MTLQACSKIKQVLSSMAGAGKRDDEDNILAHLLPPTAGAVSPFGFVEEDEEEVNYSETDEDLQSADLPGRGQREASLGGPAQEERWASLAAALHTTSSHVPARFSGRERGRIKQEGQRGDQVESWSAILNSAKTGNLGTGETGRIWRKPERTSQSISLQLRHLQHIVDCPAYSTPSAGFGLLPRTGPNADMLKPPAAQCHPISCRG